MKCFSSVTNVPSHPDIRDELTNIHFKFLPKNTRSLIKPANIGIIKNVKGFFHSLPCKRLLVSLHSPKATALTQVEKITVMDSVHIYSQAWKQVKAETMKNCFKKAFSQKDHQPSAEPRLLVQQRTSILASKQPRNAHLSILCSSRWKVVSADQVWWWSLQWLESWSQCERRSEKQTYIYIRTLHSEIDGYKSNFCKPGNIFPNGNVHCAVREVHFRELIFWCGLG